MADLKAPSVFLSYSYDSDEHAARVLALADALRAGGIDVILDRYVHPAPEEGWPLWMDRNIRDADFVLLVCTETYRRHVTGLEEPGKGRGVDWEGNLIYNLIYHRINEDKPSGSRFIPILLPGSKPDHIPTPILGHTRYQIASFDFTDPGFEALYRHLTDQPAATIPPGLTLRHILRGHLGEIRRMAWSPDGRWIASPSSDRKIIIWDAESGDATSTFTGHTDTVFSTAWAPDGQILASGAEDGTIRIWNVSDGQVIQTLREHTSWVNCVAWQNNGRMLASGSENSTILLWDTDNWKVLRELTQLEGNINSIAWSPDGRMLASASGDRMIRVWDAETGKVLKTLAGHTHWGFSLAWLPDGQRLASGSLDGTVRIWNVQEGVQINILENHTNLVTSISMSADGLFLASKSWDDTVRLWRCDTWAPVACLREPSSERHAPSVAFHPRSPVLATLGEKDKAIRIWDLDVEALLSSSRATQAIYHTTAKIVLVGDSGVGKTGLGWRLAHGEFREHSSTHGQQFWVLSQLSLRRADGIECDAVLWDLGGQPDYRLIHSLFLDDSDLALILFDPSDIRDPLHGVEYWLKQLNISQSLRDRSPELGSPPADGAAGTMPPRGCLAVLVGARIDCGTTTLAREELDTFCQRRGITGGYIGTSAKSGEGLDDLVQRMKDQIDWDRKTSTVTTATFKRIKDYVLGLKQRRQQEEVLVSSRDLRQLLEKTDRAGSSLMPR